MDGLFLWLLEIFITKLPDCNYRWCHISSVRIRPLFGFTHGAYLFRLPLCRFLHWAYQQKIIRMRVYTHKRYDAYLSILFWNVLFILSSEILVILRYRNVHGYVTVKSIEFIPCKTLLKQKDSVRTNSLFLPSNLFDFSKQIDIFECSI